MTKPVSHARLVSSSSAEWPMPAPHALNRHDSRAVSKRPTARARHQHSRRGPGVRAAGRRAAALGGCRRLRHHQSRSPDTPPLERRGKSGPYAFESAAPGRKRACRGNSPTCPLRRSRRRALRCGPTTRQEAAISLRPTWTGRCYARPPVWTASATCCTRQANSGLCHTTRPSEKVSFPRTRVTVPGPRGY